MNISGIGSNFGFSQVGGVQQSSRGRDSDGDNDGSSASGVGRGSGNPGAFLDAVFQALSQSGVSGVTPGAGTTSDASTSANASTSSTGNSTTQNPVQALGAFMHDLFSALQSQGAQPTQSGQTTPQAGTDSDGDNDGTTGVSASSGGGHHHHGGGLAKLESNLQGLIQQLASNTGTTTADTSTNGTTTTGSTPSTSSTVDSQLQQSFQSLLSSLGVTNGSTSLGGFLQALSQNLQGIGTSGNVVNTQA